MSALYDLHSESTEVEMRYYDRHECDAHEERESDQEDTSENRHVDTMPPTEFMALGMYSFPHN